VRLARPSQFQWSHLTRSAAGPSMTVLSRPAGVGADPDNRFHDLGPVFYDTRAGPERRKRATSANSKHSATQSYSHPAA